jgi:hypothetical protein
MENLNNLNSREEVQNAYTRATRNMTLDTVVALEASPGESSADSPLVAHAKACYRKLQTFSSAALAHPTQPPSYST